MSRVTTKPWRLAAATVGLGFSLAGGVARADKVSDANKKLTDLEQRANSLGTDFREQTAPDPNAADRRVIEAETLYSLKNYNGAATICLDVIEKYPQSRAYDDAINLLGESLFQDGDYLSARRYFEMAIKKNTGSKKEQEALQRLVELALRTNDFEKVEDHLDRLSKIPASQLEPSVPYVRGKYLSSRDKLDDALVAFANVMPTSPYYLQARYFVATIQVKRGDLPTAATSFDDVLKLQPKNDNDKEIQDLARLAIGRVLYERAQFDKAKEWYASIPRTSKHFGDAMYEAAWNSIKAKDYKSAYRALDLMLLQNPDSPQAPELRLLMGNLHLRMNNFFLASSQFTETLQEYEPLYKDLDSRVKQSTADPKYFDSLIGKGLEKFDIVDRVPQRRDQARGCRARGGTPGGPRRAGRRSPARHQRVSSRCVVRLERAMGGSGRVGLFPTSPRAAQVH